MRKNALLLVLALLLFAAPVASAEGEAPKTRTETITLEGMPEEITTTYFESARGYSFWYDAESIKPQAWDGEEGEGGDVDTFVPADPNAAAVRLDIYFGGAIDYTLDQAVQDTLDSLTLNYGDAGVQSETPFEGYEARMCYADDGKTSIEYFLVAVEGGIYHIVLTCPVEAGEGFGARIWQMLKSFQVTQ